MIMTMVMTVIIKMFFVNIWKWVIACLIDKKSYKKQKKTYSEEKAAE